MDRRFTLRKDELVGRKGAGEGRLVDGKETEEVRVEMSGVERE